VGVLRKSKRVISLAQLLIKQLIDANQDGNREFITFIPVICADGSRILLTLIYKNESGAIMDT